jgi:hypothetical protein
MMMMSWLPVVLLWLVRQPAHKCQQAGQQQQQVPPQDPALDGRRHHLLEGEEEVSEVRGRFQRL